MLNGELILSSNLLQEMIRHAENCLPEEACGLLVGIGTKVQEIIPVENIEHSQVRYRMKPEEQMEAFLYLEKKGWDILGIFHSHPNGPETPSESDLNEAYYPESIYIIVSRNNDQWKARGFTIKDRQSDEVIIKIE